jgi:hypothetical protein
MRARRGIKAAAGQRPPGVCYRIKAFPQLHNMF